MEKGTTGVPKDARLSVGSVGSVGAGASEASAASEGWLHFLWRTWNPSKNYDF